MSPEIRMIELLIHCDICDHIIKDPKDDLCTLWLQGIKEKLNCHPDCVELFLSCKGDWSKLPDGRVKRAIYKDSKELGDILIRNTGITLREKQGRHVLEGARISREEALSRLENIALIMYNLPKPNLDNKEFYSIDSRKQIVLMRKENSTPGHPDEELYNIIETSRE